MSMSLFRVPRAPDLGERSRTRPAVRLPRRAQRKSTAWHVYTTPNNNHGSLLDSGALDQAETEAARTRPADTVIGRRPELDLGVLFAGVG